MRIEPVPDALQVDQKKQSVIIGIYAELLHLLR